MFVLSPSQRPPSFFPPFICTVVNHSFEAGRRIRFRTNESIAATAKRLERGAWQDSNRITGWFGALGSSRPLPANYPAAAAWQTLGRAILTHATGALGLRPRLSPRVGGNIPLPNSLTHFGVCFLVGHSVRLGAANTRGRAAEMLRLTPFLPAPCKTTATKFALWGWRRFVDILASNVLGRLELTRLFAFSFQPC